MAWIVCAGARIPEVDGDIDIEMALLRVRLQIVHIDAEIEVTVADLSRIWIYGRRIAAVTSLKGHQVTR